MRVDKSARELTRALKLIRALESREESQRVDKNARELIREQESIRARQSIRAQGR